MLTDPSVVTATLKQLNIRPSKRLSQNFLIDQNILQKALDAANCQQGDCVLEIGPGIGAWTEAMLARGAQVYAVEKDVRFIEHLKELPHVSCQLTIIEEDILKLSLSDLPFEKGKIIANIPYQITSPILGRFLPENTRFSSVTIMVQEEVARRITALPKTRDYSAFTLFCQLYSTPTYCFKVSANCFYPKPKVATAVVHFVLKTPPKHHQETLFLIHLAFSQRRKMVKNTLKSALPDIEKRLAALHLNPQARPEELSLHHFLGFSSL